MAGRISYYGGIVKDGLVLHLDAGKRDSYPRQGTTWYDLSGNGNNGIISGSTFSPDNNGSFVFDGVDDYISMGTRNLIQTDFTINIWYKLNSNAVKEHFIFSNNYGITPGLLITSDDAGTGVASVKAWYHSGSVTGYTLHSSLNATQINNITLTRNGSTNVPYVKGVEITSQIFTNSTFLGSGLYELGYSTIRNKSTAYMQGNIYAAQIYNRALTSQEILQNFNALRGRYGI